MIIKPYESKYRLAAKHANVMREKRAQEGYKSADEIMADYNKNVSGEFYRDGDSDETILSSQARFLFDLGVPIYFSLNNAYRLIEKLDFSFVRYHKDDKLFEVKPDFGNSVFMKVVYLTDKIKVIKVEVQKDVL